MSKNNTLISIVQSFLDSTCHPVLLSSTRDILALFEPQVLIFGTLWNEGTLPVKIEMSHHISSYVGQ